MSANSLAADMVSAVPSTMPASFDGDPVLYGFNLFLMTSTMFLGLMMAGWRVRQIAANWGRDRLRDPVSIWRLVTLYAGAAMFLRCGAEALVLWGWNPLDADTSARVIMAKRWIDPLSIMLFGWGWLAYTMLAEPGMVEQLRKAPVEVIIWSRWPALKRPATLVGISLIAATAAVIFR